MEAHWEDMNYVAEFAYDREERTSPARGSTKEHEGNIPLAGFAQLEEAGSVTWLEAPWALALNTLLPGAGFPARAVGHDDSHQRAPEGPPLCGGSTGLRWVSTFLLLLGAFCSIDRVSARAERNQTWALSSKK